MPDRPMQALRAEMESRLRSCQAAIGQCQKDIIEQKKFCAGCRTERRATETQILAELMGLKDSVAKFMGDTLAFKREVAEHVAIVTSIIKGKGKGKGDGK